LRTLLAQFDKVDNLELDIRARMDRESEKHGPDSDKVKAFEADLAALAKERQGLFAREKKIRALALKEVNPEKVNPEKPAERGGAAAGRCPRAVGPSGRAAAAGRGSRPGSLSPGSLPAGTPSSPSPSPDSAHRRRPRKSRSRARPRTTRTSSRPAPRIRTPTASRSSWRAPAPFPWADGQRTTDVDRVLGERRILWLETGHFRIGCNLASAPMPVPQDQRKYLLDELKRLKKKLPRIDDKPKRLDPWLRLHLY